MLSDEAVLLVLIGVWLLLPVVGYTLVGWVGVMAWCIGSVVGLLA